MDNIKWTSVKAESIHNRAHPVLWTPSQVFTIKPSLLELTDSSLRVTSLGPNSDSIFNSDSDSILDDNNYAITLFFGRLIETADVFI